MATTRTYAVGGAGRVIRLDNHTGPWIDITPNFPNVGETTYFDVMCDPLDGDKVTIVGNANLSNNIGSGILVSTDAGVTWTNPAGNWGTLPGESSRVYKEVWYADSNAIWAVAPGGTIVLSTDAGVTFNRTNQPDKDLMNGQGVCIHALDQHIAIVAGGPTSNNTAPNGYVWKTTDSGLTWTRLNGTNPLINGASPLGIAGGIWMSNDQQRIVASFSYTQMLSTDGGATFNPTSAPMTRSGYHLTWFPSHAPNPPTMRHTGGPTLQVNDSGNNGTNWSITRQAEGFIMEGAHFWDTDNGYYTNTNTGNVDSTTDGGATGTVSYTSPDGFPLYAVWTQLAIVDPPAGCPCYLATNCEDPNEQYAIQVDCTVDTPFNVLTPGNIYQFSSPDYMVDKCWTVEEIDCPSQTVVDLSTGTIDIDGNLATLWDDQDFNWNVVGVAPLGATTPSTPFAARISNQTWFTGYGSIPGSLWITAGQLDGSSSCPGAIPGCQPLSSGGSPTYEQDRSDGVTIYELTFNAPINFVPLLNLTFLTDNNVGPGGITLNGNPLTYTPAGNPWVNPTLVTTSNPAFFNQGLNTLRIEIDNQGAGSNGFSMGGSIENQNPPSVEAVPVSEWIDCDECNNPIVPNICWDLEVVCEGECDDVYAINGFDFTQYIGQNITIQPPLTVPECWYTPYALRQAVFVAVPQSSGGGYNLSWPFGAFQQGTDDITVTMPSLIFNGIEQISGTPPSYLLTPLNIQFVLCQQMTCTNVPLNNPGGLTGYANTVDFINQTLASLGILTIQAYNNSFDNCPITQIKPRETFRLQYRDGDTFRLELVFNNIGQGTNTVIYEVQGSNVMVSYLNNADTPLSTCNDNIYCLTDPADSPQIISVMEMGDCPVEPIDLGEACDIAPRLGEPGFSTKNCDPKKVIDVKSKFADSVYAQFKRARFGIDTCCEFDLDKIDIKNQLIDLGFIYDPDLCVDGDPIPEDCCLQPCDAEAELIIPLAVSCPAPIDVSTMLTTPIPETTCVEVTFSVGPGGNSDVPMTARFRDCCGDLTQIEVFPGATPITLCVDLTDPITTAPGVITSEGPACACCPAPTNLVGTSVPLRLKVEIGPV